MDVYDFLRKYRESKIVKLIKNKKIEYQNEELLFASINMQKHNVINYIINNEKVNFNYLNENNTSILDIATQRDDYKTLDLLKIHNIDLYKEHKDRDYLINNLQSINTLDTLKYYENNIDKKLLKKNIEYIIMNTAVNSDIDFLEYIVKNYNIKLSKLKENLLEFSLSLKQKSSERLDKIFEYNNYISMILPHKKKYNKIFKNASEYFNLNLDKKEKRRQYYEYVKKEYDKLK